jgi:SAM-dependent methyltransferase
MRAETPANPSTEASTANFERWKDSYREEVENVVSFSRVSAQYFTDLKARELLALVARRLGPASSLTAVDVGCGVGATDAALQGRFGRLLGVDIFEGVLEAARKANPSVEYLLYDGARLPLPDCSVDVVFTISVLHHVPPSRWQAFAREMARVLRPGGMAVVFEHNPINPLTRRVVANCVFDEDAVLLTRRTTTKLLRAADLETIEYRYIAFLPFSKGWVAPVEVVLRRLPLGAQYYVAAVRS